MPDHDQPMTGPAAADERPPAVPGSPAPAPAAPELAPPAMPPASPAMPPVPPPMRPAPPAAPREIDADWRRVSPKHVVVEVVGSVIGSGITVAALLVAGTWLDLPVLWWAAAAIGAIALVAIALEPRRVRSIGYRLRADDLVFRRGIMFQRQVAVPYGRMQLVDITRGPVSRALGLADLKFVTAAAATAVTLPGLPLEEAERLRDELVALAETRRAGL
ncbi:PH domain-containing protein [Agromyces sp. C10]|uniref:PH domain-containing protein n=1 Tax=Agromyces sp. C10 TaxID=2935077 RepID=UPI00200B5F51|nr:PH domain-containing protein [Agromyces sp. C10]MCK8609210.1 PH domain-containing protein [Agromyces sp. C10]